MEKTKPINTRGADTALKVQKLLKALIECLTQETLALQSHNREVAANMAQEKIRLMMTYKAIAAELQNEPDTLKSVDEDVSKQLKSLIGDFEHALKENFTVVESGRNAVSRLINRLMTSAREAVNTTNRYYDEKGKLVERKMTSTNMPSQLNEVY